MLDISEALRRGCKLKNGSLSSVIVGVAFFATLATHQFMAFVSHSKGTSPVTILQSRAAVDARELWHVPRSVRAARISNPSALQNCNISAIFALAFALAGVVRVTDAACRRSGSRGRIACRASVIATAPDQAIPWWQRLAKPKIESGVGIWAEKLNMTTMFDEAGGAWKTVPATILVIKRGGNVVTDKKWPERHGYYSMQVGYDRYTPNKNDMKSKRAIKIASLAKNEIPPLKKLKEFRVRPQDWDKYEIGDKLWPSDLFEEGDLVDVHGRSKGKGFQGSIKLWGHKRGPMGHGSKHHRRYGSVGAGTTPGRTWPGTKMPGWQGDNRHTQKSLKVLKIIDKIDENNMPESIIIVKGSVPGYTAYTNDGGSYVYLHKKKNLSDGRFQRDPVWLWYTLRGENVDPFTPIKGKAWTWKTFWGRDLRWVSQQTKKYWPDGFPGYDHSYDPFYDGCDPHQAIKAPEW